MLERFIKPRPRKAPVPAGAMPELHEISPAEQKLRLAIARYDENWRRHMGYPRQSCVWGDCTIGPSMIGHIVQDEAKRNGYDATSKRFQLYTVHQAAGGARGNAYQHVFNVITIDGEKFLVDPTFSQFRGQNGSIGWGPRNSSDQFSSGVPNDDPLATTLTNDGYVPLTKGNLQRYLEMTTTADDRSYTYGVDPSIFDRLQEQPQEYSYDDAVAMGYVLPPVPHDPATS